MSGPFALKYLHLFLRDNQPEPSFSLATARQRICGSSPDDLADAIRRTARDSEYRYVWFATTSSSEQAYALEHGWYHRYRPSDNATSPVPYSGLDRRCTIEGCAGLCPRCGQNKRVSRF